MINLPFQTVDLLAKLGQTFRAQGANVMLGFSQLQGNGLIIFMLNVPQDNYFPDRLIQSIHRPKNLFQLLNLNYLAERTGLLTRRLPDLFKVRCRPPAATPVKRQIDRTATKISLHILHTIQSFTRYEPNKHLLQEIFRRVMAERKPIQQGIQQTTMALQYVQ
jgi:hypothetical protein